VRITKRFYLGAYETTRGQFAEFVEAENYRTEAERSGNGGYGYDAATNELAVSPKYTWRNTGYLQTDDHPASNVSWDDAREFCRWLSRKENKTYRLPTEAEWEYACRAGTTTRFYTGETPAGLTAIGNVADRSFKAKKPNGISFGVAEDDGFVFTAPVGRFKPNAFGLFDLTGNAAEWCADYYSETAYAQSKIDDPTGPATGTQRVIRGGSWGWNAASYRSATRVAVLPINAADIGFRVVLVVGE
jgi:formylglycine-generating enzyme required for sulfatase activity